MILFVNDNRGILFLSEAVAAAKDIIKYLQLQSKVVLELILESKV